MSSKILISIVISIMIVSLCNAISEGPRKIFEKTGFLVDRNNSAQCTKVQCVSGENCSEESNMKCGKFTYCANIEIVASSASSASSVGSQAVVHTEKCSAALHLGKQCQKSEDCMDYWGGAFCSPDTHVCTRARVLNETCNENATCAFPLECHDGFCVGPYSFTEGHACDTSKPNGGCHLSLYCRYISNTSSQCAKLPGLGEGCNEDVGCALPYFCSPTTSACIEPMSRDIGDSCVTSLDCKENLICAANACVQPLDNYTNAVNCSSQSDCNITSYCHCDYVTGVSMCLPLPMSSNKTLKLFNTLVECINLDPDMSLARCQTQLVDVQRSINASAIIDFECSRLPSYDNNINLLLLLVPVTILVFILILVLIVKLGIPSDK